jgi:uncharacterized protein
VTDRFKRLLAGLVDHAGWTTLLLLLVSAVALIGYVDPELRLLGFDPDGGVESTEVVDGIGRRRGGPRGTGRGGEGFSLTDGDAILVVESEGIFTPFGARALRRVVSDLEALPWVSGITWMDRAPPLNLFGLPEPVLPREDASAQRFELAREQALRNPLIVGQLLSPDADLLVLLIRFDWLMVTGDADVTDRLREVAELAVADVHRDWTAAAGEPSPISFALTGRVPIRLSLARSGEDNQFRYQMLAYAMILGLAIILFRGWVTVLVTALAPALGVFWTLGYLRYLQIHDNPFNDVILPILLSLVGFHRRGAHDGACSQASPKRPQPMGCGSRVDNRGGVGLWTYVTDDRGRFRLARLGAERCGSRVWTLLRGRGRFNFFGGRDRHSAGVSVADRSLVASRREERPDRSASGAAGWTD